MGFSRQEHWSGFSSRGIFLTQGSNLGLLHWQADLYRLGHEGNHVSGKTSYWDVISKLSWLDATTQKRREWIWTCFLPPKPTFFTLVCFLSNFIYLFLVVLCFHCCRLSPAAVIWGYSPIVGCGLPVAVTSRCRAWVLWHTNFSTCSSWASEHRLGSCSTWA